MEQSTGTVAAEHILDIQSSTLVDGLKIMEALSNADAVNLFFFAKDGISSSTNAIRALGLSQKRYYTRLKLLLEAGLIEKNDDGYRHTFMGTLVHKLGLSLLQIVENREQLNILDSISKERSLTSTETDQIARVLSIELPFLDVVDDVKIISSFEDLASTTVDCIQNAEKFIFLATQYLDIRVVDTAFNAIERGVKLKAIVSEHDQFANAMKMALSMFSNPKIISKIYKWIQSSSIELKKISIPYTFFIIDGKWGIVEIKNPITDKFQFAFYIDSETFCSKLVNVFDSLWSSASDLKSSFKLF